MLKIAIIGQQCSGKTTAARFIQDYGPQPSTIVKFAGAIYDTLTALRQPKHRAFMQEFADLAKKHFGEHVLKNVFKADVKEFEYEKTMNMIICDDVRRFYEFYCVKELGFKIIALDIHRRIRKQRAQNLHLDFIENHNSETEVPKIIEHCKKNKVGYILEDILGGLTEDILYETCIEIIGGLQNETIDDHFYRFYDSGRIYD